MVINPALVRASLIATVLFATVGLAGCGPLPALPVDGSPSPNPSPSMSPGASDTPSSPTPQPDDAAVPVSIPCTTAISPQRMYEFNPNFALLSSFTPVPGSSAATAVTYEGTVCRWVHESNGTTIDVSIARPALADREKLAAAARSGAPLDNVADESYFLTSNGVGTAQAFSGAYWMTMSSEYFASPADAAELLVAVVDSIRP
ncbi:MAG: arginyl-tRNA synthetase [Cryobacterium sp.]|nr:arginyl-tRNA synthetase [Cryobacterium sp.]